MSIRNELAEHISRLFPLEDSRYGIHYSIVDHLDGTTELEAVTGQPRYAPTQALQDQRRWRNQA